MRGVRILFLFVLITACGCAAPDTPVLAPASPAPAETASPTAAPADTPSPSPSPSPAPVPVTLYLPDADGEHIRAVESTMAEDSPVGILDALVRCEALPDVDYGRNLYFTVGDSFIKIKNKVRVPRVVARLDVSDAFLRALEEMQRQQEERTLQCLANTFITRYDAEVFMLTIEGVKLETYVRDYEKGIVFDQYADSIKD